MAAVDAASPEPGLRTSIPLGSRLNERGRLEVGGCDVVELAREFGTPAYVYAEDDIRARARAYMEALRGAHRRASRSSTRARRSRARPPTGCCAEEGLSCDVASGGELHLALAAGFDPERIYMHGNNKTRGRARARGRAPASATSSSTRSTRSTGSSAARGAAGAAARHARHQARHPLLHRDRPGGLEVRLRPRRGAGARSSAAPQAGLELRGLHAHIGSQIFDLDVFEKLGEVLAGIGDYPLLNLGGGLGIAYTDDERAAGGRRLRRRAAERRARRRDRALRARPLARRQRGRDALHASAPSRRSRACAPTWRSTAACPTTCGRCSTAPLRGRDRRPLRRRDASAGSPGMHCESGDILVRDVELDDPRAGRRAGDPRHGRLRSRDGQQLQRDPAAAGDLLPRRRRARGRAPRDLRGPDRCGMPEPVQDRAARPRDRRRRLRGAARRARRRDRGRGRACGPRSPACSPAAAATSTTSSSAAT